MDKDITFTTGNITSKDGTRIGYRQLGRGPSLILVHGGLQAAQNLMLLAKELSDEFTVYIPDRRGRGISGLPGENYGIQKESEDLNALLVKTGARYLFGLSSGALISLYAACHLSQIRKLALFEPVLSINNSVPSKFVTRYEKEISKGKLSSAFITVIKGLRMSPVLNMVPRFILQPVFSLALRMDNKNDENDLPLKEIIPTFHYDNLLVRELENSLEYFSNVHANVLLMNGSKSPKYLKMPCWELLKVIPRSSSIEFPGLDHLGPDNTGKPSIVAKELRYFFNGPDPSIM
ncbi:alpha/beta hydrolase [Sporosarcina koreensis]|uniref:Alpha/beta hydrolase n=1 Tax=Sporosarcina koreensis TaxID=334735 RepID=A0ABW0TXZ9_9BACL